MPDEDEIELVTLDSVLMIGTWPVVVPSPFDLAKLLVIFFFHNRPVRLFFFFLSFEKAGLA
jgi:hypothetical protein